jgi:hypothetical protein
MAGVRNIRLEPRMPKSIRTVIRSPQPGHCDLSVPGTHSLSLVLPAWWPAYQAVAQ